MPWVCPFLCAGTEPGHTAPAHPYVDLRAFLQKVDVLNHPLESIRRELGKHIADTVSLQHNPLPICKSTLEMAEPVAIKAAVPGSLEFVSSFVHKEEAEQQLVDLLGCSFKEIAGLLFSILDHQMDVDIQPDTDNKGYKSAVVVAELFGQLTRVWEQDFPLVGGIQLNFACVELEPGVFFPHRDNRAFFDIHDYIPPIIVYYPP